MARNAVKTPYVYLSAQHLYSYQADIISGAFYLSIDLVAVKKLVRATIQFCIHITGWSRANGIRWKSGKDGRREMRGANS
jgi:hypothetical protein